MSRSLRVYLPNPNFCAALVYWHRNCPKLVKQDPVAESMVSGFGVPSYHQPDLSCSKELAKMLIANHKTIIELATICKSLPAPELLRELVSKTNDLTVLAAIASNDVTCSDTLQLVWEKVINIYTSDEGLRNG